MAAGSELRVSINQKMDFFKTTVVRTQNSTQVTSFYAVPPSTYIIGTVESAKTASFCILQLTIRYLLISQLAICIESSKYTH
jgi:hypothetical protein